mgnify:FL=1
MFSPLPRENHSSCCEKMVEELSLEYVYKLEEMQSKTANTFLQLTFLQTHNGFFHYYFLEVGNKAVSSVTILLA